MSVAFLLFVKIQQRCVNKILNYVFKLLVIFLLLCEVIKIRMTSDTPVIISEQTNILHTWYTRLASESSA